MAVYKKVKELLDSGRKAAVVTIIAAGANTALEGKKILYSGDELIYSALDRKLTESIISLVAPAISKGQNPVLEFGSGHKEVEKVFIHLYRPSPNLIIFGGGHVGAALCRMAALLDYEITLVDDRPSYAAREVHPDAKHLICEPFERAFDQIIPTSADYIVIVTRGHKHDRLCLEKALSRDAAYLGMIGSKRRVCDQLKDLAAAGYAEKQLAAVHSPIGLSIGAVTEAEIALSILAEITRVRRCESSGETYQKDVLQALNQLEEEGNRAVLATIIKAQGSTPRKTGSQMIIYPDGLIKGTIGGGCSEAEVRREALNCLERGSSGSINMSLTADAAAEEGMICGGAMEIYLEYLPSSSH